ncbi:hypothetical protein DXX93_10215 [Thalassotalea euphylliae]|uniref:Uncharacterized protein n=1 Tax=Thalassotalea euphylliae TaxID=1655234 RepID=A0A3E0TQM6_9GAMM|nr:tetratricopeptide repeat protein [Thalassotalea euphylliae]REL26906.1 hypothetical protein DXX93_10215 [Thalassotalea euphylliae]
MNNYLFFSKPSSILPSAVLTGVLLLSASFSQASSGTELEIKLEQPKLLMQQISASELGIKPVLTKGEQQYHQLINDKLKNKQYRQLLETLKQQIDIEQASAAMAYLLGQLALQQQQFQVATKYFEQAIKKQTGYGKAHHGLALAKLQLKQYTSASAHLVEAMQLGVKDAQLYSYLGYSYIQANNFHSAVVAYQQAKLLAPDDNQVNQSLLYAYSQAGQTQAALSLLTQMLNQEPNNADLWLHRANVLLVKQQYQRAIASLETAIRLDKKKHVPTSADNIALTAQLQLQYGSIARAEHLYQQIWREHANPELVIDAVEYLLAKQQLNSASKLLGQINKGQSKTSKSLSSQQQSQLAYLNGKVQLAKGKRVKADKYFQQALALNAVNGQALLASAQLKRRAGQSHQAQMLLLRAANLDEFKLNALTEHADLMMTLGRYRKALELLQQALDFAPSESSIFENIKILERIVSQEAS